MVMIRITKSDFEHMFDLNHTEIIASPYEDRENVFRGKYDDFIEKFNIGDYNICNRVTEFILTKIYSRAGLTVNEPITVVELLIR